MSFKATLELGSQKFDVIHCSFTFRRDVDPKGRPSSGVYGGTVQFQIESTDDTSVLEAMLNNVHKAFGGTVTFYKREEADAKMKALTFTDAYVIQYTESIDAVGNNPMAINFVISARELKMENATHVNDWPVKK